MLGTATVDGADAHVSLPPDGFAPLLVKEVISETADAVSLVFDVPGDWDERFTYQAGQFVTVRIVLDGTAHLRCYSMSSSPLTDDDLRITVKRDREGVVSNWLNDHVSVGDKIHTAPPAGRFVSRDGDRDLVAFAGGSGVTPIFSLIRSALAGSGRHVTLFYANRGPASVIFGSALAALAEQHPGRLVVHHHLDQDSGVVTPAAIQPFVGIADADYFVCGPAPFMDTVEKTVVGTGVAGERLHLERFSVVETTAPAPADVITTEVTIKLDRHTVTVPYRAGNTVLQTARMAGLRAPSSCETGSCGTCIAQVTDGSARMLNNDALEDDEVADGLILTCQSLPTSTTITVIYE
ncbi:MAG: ferredoxin--NADP reductase [Mycobacterium sp.]